MNYNKVKYEVMKSTPETLLADLKAHGVAVVPGVFSETECTTAISLAHNYLSRVFEDDANNVLLAQPATWANVTKTMYAKHGGLLQHFGCGQSAFAWYAREAPAVRSLFQKLWSTPDLVVSFDGINVTPPPEVTGCGWQPADKMWLHTDQSEKKAGLHSIQGLANFATVSEGDATLCVIKGSHQLHAAFFAKFGLHAKGDWQLITEEQLFWFLDQEYDAPEDRRRCELVAVKAGAGDMVFWDSRTIHMGLGPSPGRPNKEHWRYVAYVAMFPRSKLKAVQLEKRKTKYLEEGRTTNHWGTKLFAEKPHTYGKPICKERRRGPPILSAAAKKLI